MLSLFFFQCALPGLPWFKGIMCLADEQTDCIQDFAFLISYIKNTDILHRASSVGTSEHALYTHVPKLRKVRFLSLLHHLLYFTS